MDCGGPPCVLGTQSALCWIPVYSECDAHIRIIAASVGPLGGTKGGHPAPPNRHVAMQSTGRRRRYPGTRPLDWRVSRGVPQSLQALPKHKADLLESAIDAALPIKKG